MLNDFRIEKSRLPVEITLASGEDVAGELFVQASATHRFELAEAPEIMNSPEPFFPLRLAGGETLLVAREHVREVRVPASPGDDEWMGGAVSQVRITMVGGAQRDATMRIQAISSQARVLDVLNHAHERFFPVHHAGQLVLINRTWVEHVQEVSRGAA